LKQDELTTSTLENECGLILIASRHAQMRQDQRGDG
jgi:hypothetical protein